MKRSWLVLAVAALAAISFVLTACYGSEYRHKTHFTEQTGYLEAKDRPAGMSCTDPRVVIQDCNDACSCCYQGESTGQNNNMGYCIIACDNILNYETSGAVNSLTADPHAFGECVFGCISQCGGNDASNICYEECKGYLGIS
jgi:hypothetical protein